MKIKAIKKPYEELIEEYRSHKIEHVKPIKPNIFFRTLLKLVSIPDLIATHFHCEKIGMDKLGKKEPALFLMNHSSFIDLEIVASALYPRSFNIVTTTDGFIGKDWLMRHIGCIPTKKFVADTTSVRDIMHTVKNLHSSIVMFPEAGYSLDGPATTLPDTLGSFVKMLGIPLVMITTYGAFSRDPLYNNLQRRRVNVSATVEYLLDSEQVKNTPADDINAMIQEKFSFDYFKWQREHHIRIGEKFRADGLDRALYKCPDCGAEGRMHGQGITLKCLECGKTHELDEYGSLIPVTSEDGFTHVPDWYRWEREEVKREIEEGKYGLDIPVDVWVSLDTKKLYDVGEGRLRHTTEGFVLSDKDGKVLYEHKPLASHSICADFNFYEVGDVIAIANPECIYYCFPKDQTVPVAKARLAAEEIYKIKYAEKIAERREKQRQREEG